MGKMIADIIWPFLLIGLVLILIRQAYTYVRENERKKAEAEARNARLTAGDEAQERQDEAMRQARSTGDFVDDDRFLPDEPPANTK